MKQRIVLILAVALSPLLFTGCGTNSQAEQQSLKANFSVHSNFGDYWYAGEAEISSYAIEQARYGAEHTGEAVLVFVTEDFSKSQQVKLDRKPSKQDDLVKILKLNYMKRFNTGIYTYSLMKSVFTPVDFQQFPNTMKVSSSLQDWCGHTFFQLNLNKKGFEANQFSYFQSEGDKTFDLEKAFLEDEIWTRLRLNPESLPIGTVKMIPDSFDAKLRHYKHDAVLVNTSNTVDQNNSERMVYTVEYPNNRRKLTIYYRKKFPHQIEAWEEQLGNRGTTKATLKKTIKSAYWSKNGPNDGYLRDSLQLAF